MLSRRLALAVGAIAILLVLAVISVTHVVANTSLAPDPVGKITLLAPCDKEKSDAVDKLQTAAREALNLTKAEYVFISQASVTSDADGSIFQLNLTVKDQDGTQVATGETTSPPIKKGASAQMTVYAGASLVKGNKYDVATSVKLKGGQPLNEKKCNFTAPE